MCVQSVLHSTPASMKCVQVATTVSAPGQARRFSSLPSHLNSVRKISADPCPKEAPTVALAPMMDYDSSSVPSKSTFLYTENRSVQKGGLA